jgi:hypothetical protein
MNRPLMVVLEGEIEVLSDQNTVITVRAIFPATSISFPTVRRSRGRGPARPDAFSSCPRNVFAALCRRTRS